MAGKRKELEKNSSPVIKKKIKKSKPNKDFSDDEDLSDIEDAGEIFSGIRIPPILPPVTAAEENPGPRLIIKNIVANNFKSYFGKVTIGPFHKSLTSIVGANGSGKSNVIDSLLFVFGYRSSKIRSKKVSVLIHNSEKHRDVLQCSVTVNFMLINDDDTKENGYVVVPDSELTITRTANKDNSSFYTLNNKRVKFKDVAIILKKNGIDLIHNRFLILQGEVEQIAMMKPKAENDHSTGMLEYLEDIIGTVRYKEPILKLEEKVNDLSLEKSEKLSRLKYVVKERGELIEPVKEIIQYQQQENKLNWQKNKNYQKELFKLNEKIDADTEKLQKTKDEINSIDNELAGFEKKKENENKIIGDFSVKLQTDIKKLDKLGKEIQICNQKSDKIKHSLLDKTNEIKQYENSVVQEKKKITKAEAVPKVKECELKRLESELTSLEEECMTLEENYTKIHSSGFEKSKKFREKKESLVPDELKLQTIFGNKQNLFQTLKTEFEVLLDTEKSEKEKLRVLEEQMTKGVDEFQENERKKEKAEADMNNFRNKIRDWEENIQNLKNDEQEIKTKLQNIRQSLTEKRTAYAETTGRSRPIQYVLKLKDQGRINGILGRCGDYGQVEGKYDIPVCTACGSTDQIVVETSEAAQSCIDMLKKNKIGRLTFSVLPQIQQYQPNADAVHTYPENSIRVFDLIKILDQRFRLTFYTGLYETLLAEDLDQARRISFRPKSRLRVVTFKGEIIDKSGIISGGGKPIRGKIGPQETRAKYSSGNTHQVSQNEVEKLDKIAKELENKLRETETKIFDLKDNVEQHSRLIDELNTVIRQCVSRMNAWKAKKIQVENLIETQKLVIVKKKTDPIAVANKEAEIKKAEEELNVAKKDYHSIKSKVDDLNKKIKEITEGEPREAKCLLDEANDKLVKTRTAINQVNVSVEAAERQIKKSKTQIETLKDRIDEAKKEVEALNEDSLEYNSKTAKYNESYDEMKEDIDKQRQHIKELKNMYDDGFQRVNELRESKLTLKRNLKTIEDSITHLLDICDSKKKKLSGLKLHIIRQIDGVVRDPVIESYKEFDKNNKENEEEGENSQKIIVEPQEENDQNQMEVNHEDQNIPKLEDFTNKGLTDLPQFSREQLADFNPNDFENILEKEDEIKKTKPNFILLEEYDKRTKQYNEKYAEVAAVLDLYNSHNDMLNKVRQRRKDEFMVSFTKITIKLKEMYQMITLGGDAELDIVDSLDPFSAGIIFGIRPPKKSWKYMVNLSGGEKTLSSLALVFALHYYKPSPLYVMDEIDAALDFKNVSIIGHYIKERTKNSQFIIISLRSNMFEKANLLVGIYKTDDCTDTSVVKTDEYAHLLKGPLATKYHNQ